MKITKKEISENTQVSKISFSNFQYKTEVKGILFEARNDNQQIICYDKDLSIELGKRENYLEVGNKKDFIDSVYKIATFLM